MAASGASIINNAHRIACRAHQHHQHQASNNNQALLSSRRRATRRVRVVLASISDIVSKSASRRSATRGAIGVRRGMLRDVWRYFVDAGGALRTRGARFARRR